jgi:hypothetical protein
MYKTEAFLRTLFFIGMLLFILWMIQSHSAPYGLAVRPMYYILIILALIAVAPFVYRLSVKHLSKKKYTRDDYIKEAIWSGCLALCFTLFAVLNIDGYKTVTGRWLVPLVWLIAAAIALFMASKAKKTEYTRHE